MSFYHFRQNNSGGSFDYKPDAGISVHVIVEAKSADEANNKARRIGIYFDGCDDGRDCSCCGNRWHRVDNSEWSRSDVPRVYSDEVRPHDLMPGKDEDRCASKWREDGEGEGFIHYADGRVEPFWQHQAERKDLDGAYGYGVTFSPHRKPDIFVVGNEGYDETGNKKAPGQDIPGDDGFRGWIKPDRAMVVMRKDYGWGHAWFATHQEAQDFALKIQHATDVLAQQLRMVRSLVQQTNVDYAADLLDMLTKGSR